MSESPVTKPEKSLLFFGRDFMIGSRVEGVARNHSLAFRRVEKKDALHQSTPPPQLVLFDLAATGDDLPEMISELRARNPAVSLAGLAFHTDEASLEKGKKAGLDSLITRSHLVDGLNRLLEKGQ